MQIKLGEQIKEFRCRDKRTQEDLANALGVTPQAISRWEKGICYPDVEYIPSIANFFGISIDELFGYCNERGKKMDELVEKVQEMNARNNGMDVCMDECIRLAREGMLEFPGNEKMMLCLASVLYNAGYVRHGEHHLTDGEGYDRYDAERHQAYEEWQEAVGLYEKLLLTLREGKMRHQAVRELMQLYANMGESEKAAAVAETAPGLSGCREFLRLKAYDGQERAEAYGRALLEMADAYSDLIIQSIITNKNHIRPEDAVQMVRNAIGMFFLICTDGNYGLCHADLICLNLYLSEHLWLAGKHEEAFAALDEALEHAKKYEDICRRGEAAYTAPLLSMVKIRFPANAEAGIVSNLPKDWPWWHVPDASKAGAEMKADPRWAEWVKKTQQSERE